MCVLTVVLSVRKGSGTCVRSCAYSDQPQQFCYMYNFDFRVSARVSGYLTTTAQRKAFFARYAVCKKVHLLMIGT